MEVENFTCCGGAQSAGLDDNVALLSSRLGRLRRIAIFETMSEKELVHAARKFAC